MKLLILIILILAVNGSWLHAQDSSIVVDGSKTGEADLVKKFDMCQTGWSPPDKWLRVGKGRVGPMKCKQVRFVGSLLHRKWGGKPFCKEIMDILKAEGAAPYICMDPNTLVKGQDAVHGYPPDMKAWRKLVREAAAQAKNYGCVWYEVWNEPNYPVFWKGSKQQMFEMYKIMVQEVAKVDPQAKFVSPGITSAGIPKWVGPFLDYVEKEDLPLHAIAFHDFGRDYNLAERWIMNHVRDIQAEINKRPKFKAMNLEIHVGECSFFGDPKNGDPADCAEAAARLPRFFRVLNKEPQLTLVQWAQLFDTGHDGHWGNLGVVDTELSKQKPLYNVFVMYAMMPVRSLACEENGPVKALASKNDSTIAIMLYNEGTANSVTTLSIREHGFPAATQVYKYMFAVDAKHSSFHETPGTGRLELVEKVKVAVPAGGGSFELEYDVPGPGVKLIMLSSEPIAYDKYVIERKIKGMPQARTMTQGIKLSKLKSYEAKLLPGRAIKSIMTSLKTKAKKTNTEGDEAKALVAGVSTWIQTELKRAQVLKDIRPGQALQIAGRLLKTIKGMSEESEVLKIYKELNTNPQIRTLAKLRAEIDAHVKMAKEQREHSSLPRNAAKLKTRLHKYIGHEGLVEELKEEAEELRQMLQD